MEKLMPTILAAKSGDRTSKEFILKKFKPLVHKLAWKHPHLSHEDLVQEGFLGLLDAIETYDESHGAAFFTWAYWKIRGRNTQFSRSHKSTYSLDYQYEGGTLGELLADEKSEFEVKDDYSNLMDAVKIVRECTSTPRSYQIVSDRIGLHGEEPLDNQSVSRKYGISKQCTTNCMNRFRKQALKKFPELQGLL